jgi:hypothetical protein
MKWQNVTRVLLVLVMFAALLVLAAPAFAAGDVPDPSKPITPQGLGALAGLVLSLVMAYVPWVKDRYSELPGEWRAGVMLAVLTVTAIGIFAGACNGVWDFGVQCSRSGFLDLAGIWFWAVIGNQATFALAVEPYREKKTDSDL